MLPISRSFTFLENQPLCFCRFDGDFLVHNGGKNQLQYYTVNAIHKTLLRKQLRPNYCPIKVKRPLWNQHDRQDKSISENPLFSVNSSKLFETSTMLLMLPVRQGDGTALEGSCFHTALSIFTSQNLLLILL